MWSRVSEVMFGVWFSLSPFIFRHAETDRWLWINDLTCALLIISISLVSCWRPMRHAHLALLAVSIWLVGVGFLAAPHPTPPALQNHIVVGLLLFMFGVIPNNASQPPQAWQEFNRQVEPSGAHETDATPQ